MMNNTRWENEYRLTTVCVDSYDNGELAGRFYNLHMDDEKSFRSLIQFLKGMENLLDGMNFPQSFNRTKSFSSPPASASDNLSEKQVPNGDIATFAVRVIFRQNSSWQGSVIWLNQGKEQSFRSVLELVLLMDNALNESLSAKSP